MRRGEEMPGNEPTPPVSDDDFPEFAEPPRHKPPMTDLEEPSDERTDGSAQDEVDDVIARIKRHRDDSQA